MKRKQAAALGLAAVMAVSMCACGNSLFPGLSVVILGAVGNAGGIAVLKGDNPGGIISTQAPGNHSNTV